MDSQKTDPDKRYEADDFLFPYAAYPIQVDLMNAIYKAIDTGSIGLFESPTGTVRILRPIFYPFTMFSFRK